MHQSNVVDRQAVPFSPKKSGTRRTLKIEDLGDRWSGKALSGIRLKGRWLFRAGFRPGQRVDVIVPSPGIMQLIVVPESGGAFGQDAQVPEQARLALEFANASDLNMRPGE